MRYPPAKKQNQFLSESLYQLAVVNKDAIEVSKDDGYGFTVL
jgi:hypothetical protein